jgi:hypothetical protein
MPTPYHSAYTGVAVDAAVAEVEAAASAATVSTLVVRDAAGRFKAASPAAAADVAIMSYVDAKISGTINTIVKFATASSIGNSTITDDGTTVTVGAIKGVVSYNSNAPTVLGVANTTSGTGGQALLIASLNGPAFGNNNVYLGVNSALFATDGLNAASASVLYSYGQTSLNLFTYDVYPLVLGTSKTARFTVSASASTMTGNGASTIATSSGALTLAPATTVNISSLTNTYIPKAGALGAISNSTITDDGTTVTTSSFLAIVPTTTTAIGYLKFANSGGISYLGIENSVGSQFLTGAPAYALCLASAVSRTLCLGTSNGTLAAQFSGANTTLYGNLTFNVASTIATSSGALTLAPAAGSNLDVTVSDTGNFAVNTTELVVDTGVGVGIGTASPVAKTHIEGTSATYMRQLRMLDTAKGTLDFGAISGAAVISTDSWDLAFNTNSDLGTDGSAAPSNERMRITSAGNVGIGTTAPNSRQENVSVARATAFVAGTGSTWNDLIIRNPDPTNGNAVGLFFQNHGTYESNAGVGIAAVTTNVLSDYTSDLVFITRPTGVVSQERMRITSAGNVGIGTTTPQSLLHIKGSDSLQFLRLHSVSEALGALSGLSFTVGADYQSKASIALESDYTWGRGDLLFMIDNTADNSEVTVADEVMRIARTGKVGIGTTAPGELLTVQGTGVNEVAADPRLVVKVGGPSGAKGGFIGYSDAEQMMTLMTNGASSGINFWTHNGSAWGERLRIHTNGNVGIGTTAPSTLLHVGLAGTTQGTIGIAGSASGLVTITTVAAAGTWTLTLPAAVGTAGYQLTDAAGNGVTSWAAAASKREYKNILSTVTSKTDALLSILRTPIYNFRYKEGVGTGDYKTVYTGLMADEAPWAMHFDGGILNPINMFGYTVLSIQALHDKIEKLEEKVRTLENQ